MSTVRVPAVVTVHTDHVYVLDLCDDDGKRSYTLLNFACNSLLANIISDNTYVIVHLSVLRKTIYYFFIVINLDLFVNHEDLLTSYRIIMRTEQPTECVYHIIYGG